MSLVSKRTSPHFTNILKQLSIHVFKFDLSRCDERTFYITITVQYSNHSTTCDLIFLIDREELFGAISLNHLYENVQHFFAKHFNYQLLYTDEIQLAQLVTCHPKFIESMRQYKQTYNNYETTFSL